MQLLLSLKNFLEKDLFEKDNKVKHYTEARFFCILYYSVAMYLFSLYVKDRICYGFPPFSKNSVIPRLRNERPYAQSMVRSDALHGGANVGEFICLNISRLQMTPRSQEYVNLFTEDGSASLIFWKKAILVSAYSDVCCDTKKFTLTSTLKSTGNSVSKIFNYLESCTQNDELKIFTLSLLIAQEYYEKTKDLYNVYG